MAKKTVIEGNNILHNLSDPWGGVGDGNPVYNTNVPEGSEWGMNHGEVERFIKDLLSSNVRHIYRFDTKITKEVEGIEFQEDACFLLGFASELDCLDWLSSEKSLEDSRIITKTEIPTYGSGYSILLSVVPPASVLASSDFNVLVTALSVYTANGLSQDIYEPIKLTIQTSSTGETWMRAGTATINSNVETPVSLKGMLPNGDVYVRMIASGAYSTSVAVVFNVKIVNLQIGWAARENAVPRTTSDDNLLLRFNITGAVLKYLFILFDENPLKLKYISLPDSTTGTIYTATIGKQEISNILEAGTHTIKAWLEYTADGITITSNELNAEYVVSDGQSHIIAINNIALEISNFTAVSFFNWYTNYLDDVVFTLIDKYNNTEYGQWVRSAEANTIYTLSSQLGIENVQDTLIYAVMHITDGTNLIHQDIEFIIDNTADFAPVSGPIFVLSPSIYSNEYNPDTIINSATDTVVENNYFLGFDFISDGWIVSDYKNDLIRVLRVPAGRTVQINYNPFFGHVSAGYNSMTFEIDFLTDNIIDTELPIVVIGSTTKGLTIYPDHAILRTENLKLDSLQNVAWAEGIRTHLTVTLNSRNTFSYAKMYVNGVLDREFSYSTEDKFTDEGATILIGNNNTDIDIFGIRCYDSSLTSRQVLQDYKASMSNLEDKIIFSARNDILNADGEITWENCLGKYNIIGHTGPLPSVATGNHTYEGINLEIRFAEDLIGNSIIMKNLKNKGQGTTAMNYYWWNQQYTILSDSNPEKSTHFFDMDENEISMKGYNILNTEPLAKKLVGKVNFASSMLSHKLGLTWAYTDVYKLMVQNGNMSNPGQFENTPNARLAVLEKPFIFFHRNSESDTYEFRNLMTFGAGKGDKPTFGFKGNENMFMVEGADNDVQLALFNMPWDDNYIRYNEGKEAWCYVDGDGNLTDIKNINFGFGTTDDNGVPDNPTSLLKIKDFFNFVYEHSTRIEYAGATASVLSWNGQHDTPQLWINNGDVYRWDMGSGRWVNTGINVIDLYRSYTNGSTLSISNTTQATNNIINARVAHFKQHANEYFHVKDALYHYCFIKLFAATDNRAKNTYYYTDPVDLKIRWMLDDLDTVIKTNNSGQQIKPYWVEEHTKNGISNYWAAENSVFNLLLEKAYDHDIIPNGETFTIQSVMRNMLFAMSLLGNSLMGFMEKYLLSTQDYFPEVAYNEQARCVYEFANENHSNPNVPPLTLSCGSLRWSEYLWLLDRIMFISSWCRYGYFTDAGLGWRGILLHRTFDLTPAKWMYPRITQASSIVGNTQLTAPGETFETTEISTGDESLIIIHGNDYLWYLGDMDITSDNATFTFSGKRLRAITVNEDGLKTSNLLRWNIQSLTINSINIERFIIRNAATLSNELNLSKCVRLLEINLSGTNVTNVILPQTGLLTSLTLPSSITSLVINGLRNLSSITVDNNNYSNIKVISVTKNNLINTLLLFLKVINNVDNIINGLPQLTSMTFENVNWTINSSQLLKLLLIPNVNITGNITVTGSVTFDLALQVLERWPYGNDSLQILYAQEVMVTNPYISLNIPGVNSHYLSELGQYLLHLSALGNDVTKVSWRINTSLLPTGEAEINDDGLLTVTRLNDEGDTTYISVECIIETKSNPLPNPLLIVYNIGLYYREAEVGDFVFSDGTWSDFDDGAKTVIGICFYSTYNTLYELLDRRMVGLRNIELDDSTQTNSGGDGCFGRSIAVSNPSTFNLTILGLNPQYPTYGRDWIGTLLSWKYMTNGLLEDNKTEWYGYNNSILIPFELYVTLYYIRYRDLTLSVINNSAQNELYHTPDWYVGKQLDDTLCTDEMAALEAAMHKIAAEIRDNDNNDKYKTVYYPAISTCWAFNPTNNTNPKFAEHTWWLPSLAELRLIANLNTIVSSSKFNKLSGSFWSCDEASFWVPNHVNDFHYVLPILTNGTVSTLTDAANFKSGYRIRPVSKF